MKKMYKKIFIFIGFLILLGAKFTFAATSYENVQNVSLTVLVDMLSRALSILISLSTVAFALYVIYGGVKMSLAWGEPKNFESAKNSLFWTAVGFCIVIGFFAVLRIVFGLVGGPTLSPSAPFEGIKTGIEDLQQIIGK